ncbi:unnamed protein product, partial [Gongylonema pulchrum]|uniref:BTB domain-containing protein n=1 Tax=Gongylonema pulchrum TaxID=637853 RepID=A0A183DDS0_9BILA
MRVEVPDVTTRAFKTLINFIYSDLNVAAVELDGDVVMQTLYAAKKYDVKMLVKACGTYLTNSLTAANAVGLLEQAYFFDEPVLVQHCWKTIDTNTDEALSSPGKHSS